MRRISKKELLSIPNLMGYFRLIMIPVFVWLYLKASTDADYYRAAIVMGISSITDMFDGMIARKFNMITEFGKFLDPLADKLTHGAILLCLWSRYPLILLLLVLFVLKERLHAGHGRHQAPGRQEVKRRQVVRQMLYRASVRGAFPPAALPPHVPCHGQCTDFAVRGSHVHHPASLHTGISQHVSGLTRGGGASNGACLHFTAALPYILS